MTDEESPFTVQIPEQVLPGNIHNPQQEMGGVLAKGVGLLASMSPVGNTTRIYKLEARLKISWGIDAKDSADITIHS